MRSTPRHVAQIALLAGVYLVTARFGLMMDAVAGFATLVWPPTGISLAALLILGSRLWPGVALGAFLANMLAGAPLLVACGIAAGNTGEALLGAYVLGRIPGFRNSLERVRDVIVLLVLAALASTTVSATIGVSSLYLGGIVSLSGFGETWRAWWLGDVMGDLVVAPLLLAWSTGFVSRRIRGHRVIEGAGLAASLGAASLLVFGEQGSFDAYLFFPMLVWAALRFGQKGVVTTTFAISAVAVWGTVMGRGPFVGSTIAESLFALQAFMAVAATTFLVLGGIVAERSRLMLDLFRHKRELEDEVEERTADLARSVALFSQAQSIAHIGSFSWDLQSGAMTWSDELYRILGLGRKEDAPTYPALIERVHPDDRHGVENGIREALGAAAPFQLEHRIVRPNGTVRVLFNSGHLVSDDSVVGFCQDISERKQAEEALRKAFDEVEARVQERTAELAEATRTLRESERRKAAILDASLDAFITIDRHGKIVAFNRAAESIFGYRSDEVMGKEMAGLLVPPRYREQHRQGLSHFLRTGEGPILGKRVEFPALRANGSEITAEIAVEVIQPDGPPLFTASIRDVSERRRDETRREFMLEATSLLAASLDYEQMLTDVCQLSVPRIADWCAVDAVDADGQLRRVGIAHVDSAMVEQARELNRRNPIDSPAAHGAARVVSEGESELVADIPDSLLVSIARDPEHLKALRSLGLRSYLAVPIRAGNEVIGAMTFATSESLRELDESDLALARQLAGSVAIGMERARLLREMRRARDDEQRARLDAEEAVRVRDAFLSVASHELRNPLGALHLAVELFGKLAAAGDTDRAVQTAARMRRQIRRLSVLVDKLLDVSRITAGKLHLDVEPADLTATVHEVVTRFEGDIAQSRCEVEVRSDGPAVGLWDPTRLDQIVTNLLTNALKYGAGQPIEMRVESDEEMARLIVCDHGIGIAPEDQGRIFERFESLRTEAGQVAGLGLGLWIVGQIISALEGTVRVESALGEGATFTVELPRRTAEMPDDADTGMSGQAARVADVLVVEDDVDALEAIADILRQQGYRVAGASNGREALEYLRGGEPPSLILLDLMMPEMSGHQFLREKAREAALTGIPVVLVSGDGQLARKADDPHVAGYIAKPVDLDTLLSTIERYCR